MRIVGRPHGSHCATGLTASIERCFMPLEASWPSLIFGHPEHISKSRPDRWTDHGFLICLSHAAAISMLCF